MSVQSASFLTKSEIFGARLAPLKSGGQMVDQPLEQIFLLVENGTALATRRANYHPHQSTNFVTSITQVDLRIAFSKS